MATIFPEGLRVLSGPVEFEWLDNRIAGSGPNSPNVYLTGAEGQYTGIAGGEQINLSRGSTAQINVAVTFAAPGGGPGTKTLAEMVTDINNVFGIAAGKPTDFAFAWQGVIRLVDSTVGLNTALAEVLDYVGANEAAKNALFVKVGLPAAFIRDIVTPARPVRDCGLDPGKQNDDASCISANFITIPAGAKALWLQARAGSLGDSADVTPIFSLAFSDGVGLEPPIGANYLSAQPGAPSLFDPNPLFGAVSIGGGAQAFTVPQGNPGIFKLPGGPIITLPDFTRMTDFMVEIPKWAPVRARCVANGTFNPTPNPKRFSARVGVRAWVLG